MNEQNPIALRVIKLGGSLLGSAGLKNRIENWLCQSNGLYRNVWIVGGGVFVNRLRGWQTQHGLSDPVCHVMAIEMMEVNARYIADLFGWELHAELEKLNQERQQATNSILNPMFLSRPLNDPMKESVFGKLPHDWTVTSDSIACAVAVFLNAPELVLLKPRALKPQAFVAQPTLPCASPTDGNPPSVLVWENDGLVDRYFPHISEDVAKIQLVHLK